MINVLVLGCGPAGLMAAQGASDSLADSRAYGSTMIISRKAKSPIYGCQYLHQPIPKVTPGNPIDVAYTLRGEPEAYRRKVYGRGWDGTVSVEDLTDEHPAWDLRATYDRLWRSWEQAINHGEIEPADMMRWLDQYTLVINTLPRPALCTQGHGFASQEVWAAGDAPELGIRLQFQCPEGMVVCNGEDNPAWYRMSRVYGHTTVEWPGSLRSVPVSTAARVQKPLSHSCTCWPDDRLLHTGRYGSWSKGILSHEAYFSAYKRVDELIGADSGASA